MQIHVKKVVALASGAILLSGLLLGQTTQASIITEGTATLADVFGTISGPEALPVAYSVSVVSGVYTYSYQVANPIGDVLLNNNGTPTSTPEVVDSFSVTFNTMLLFTFVTGSQSGGTVQQNHGVSGLYWSFVGINPGSSSPILSFVSFLPPTFGNAAASDANPPSPWSSDPFGQQVPIPDAGSVVPVIQTAQKIGSSFIFMWNALPTQMYQIQSTTNLAQAHWTALGGAITATNYTMTISEPIGTNSPQFYRVVLLL